MPVASPTAAARPSGRFAGSSTSRVMPARRASAARRPSRSLKDGALPAPGAARAPVAARAFARGARFGRSITSRSTARPDSSAPAITNPSSGSAGVTTTSHAGSMPRATASTGSSAAARSSQATIPPAACVSAASRRASVVRPLEASPRIDTPMPRGTPPGPRIESSSANPVEKTFAGSAAGAVAGTSRAPGSASSSAGSGTVASAPITAGAAPPHLERRVASAALSSVDWVAMGQVSNICSNESTPAQALRMPQFRR